MAEQAELMKKAQELYAAKQWDELVMVMKQLTIMQPDAAFHWYNLSVAL
jgi:hypothetical protein